MKLRALLAVLTTTALHAQTQTSIDWPSILRPSREALHHHKLAQRHAFRETHDNHPRNRPIPFVIQRYALDIDADPAIRFLQGKSKIQFTSRVKDLESVTIDAYDMEILSTRVDNQDAVFHYNGESLVVMLNKALSYNQSASLEIHYQAKRSQNFYHVGPDPVNPSRMPNAYTFTQPEDSRKWFPCLDRPLAKAPFEIRVTVPEPYLVLSNGTLLEETHEGKKASFHYKIDEPISPYLVSLAIGNYERVSLGDFHGKPLSLWTPSHLKDAALFDTQRTRSMMEVFSRFTGMLYPFASYTQSVAGAWEVSMEHQSASTLGSWVITGDLSDEATVAHELAHQWFGDWVTPETWGDLWLSEGFATYLPYVLYDALDSHNKALGEVDDWRQSYFGEAKRVAHALSPLNPDLDSMFDAHAYEKGALVIKLMRFTANLSPSGDGKESFLIAVKNYLQTHGRKTVRHTDLQHALEQATGQSWQIFFDQWVRSPGHPQLKVNYDMEDRELVLKVHQTQSSDSKKNWPVFQLSIPVDIYAENGTRIRRTVELYDSTQELRLIPGFPVAAVDFDPDWDTPTEIHIEEGWEAWMKVLKHSPSETARINAMRQVISQQPLAPKAFVDLLLADASLYLKASALAKLSTNKDNRVAIERIIADLLIHRHEWDRLIRNAVAAAQAWLVEISAQAREAVDEAKLQREFQKASLTVLERKSILDKLKAVSITRTQTFVLDRLPEARWSMRDRKNMVEVLSKLPRDTSHDFLKEALDKSAQYWFRSLASDLVLVAYDKADLVPILLQRAKHDPLIAVRIKAIDLLGVQKSSKEGLCGELNTLAKAKESKPDRLEGVRDAASAALTKLECNAGRGKSASIDP